MQFADLRTLRQWEGGLCQDRDHDQYLYTFTRIVLIDDLLYMMIRFLYFDNSPRFSELCNFVQKLFRFKLECWLPTPQGTRTPLISISADMHVHICMLLELTDRISMYITCKRCTAHVHLYVPGMTHVHGQLWFEPSMFAKLAPLCSYTRTRTLAKCGKLGQQVMSSTSPHHWNADPRRTQKEHLIHMYIYMM